MCTFKAVFFDNLLKLVSLTDNQFFMNKLSVIITVLFVAMFSFSACNNGKYDANPSSDLSNYVNPTNPKGGINTTFNWSGTAPMSCEISGNYWQAENADFNQVTINNNSFIEVVGSKNSVLPHAEIHLFLKAGDVHTGSEISLDWTNELNGYAGQYYADADSVYHGVNDRVPYIFNSGIGGTHGSAKIDTFDGQHLKGRFYMIPRNNKGFFLNFQKGYFDITK
jgi:hypothetical protein